MFDFDRLLNWKLLRGSHQFPGPDGRTCVVEAAIVAAGYPYRSLSMAGDFAANRPASFSAPLTAYAVCLNDANLDDALRQELLLPFVTRFAGSADTPEVENERAKLMRTRTISAVLAPALAHIGFGVWARKFLRNADDSEKLRDWLATRLRSGRPLPPQAFVGACQYVVVAAKDAHEGAWCAATAGTITADQIGDPVRMVLHRAMAAILNEAFAIGRQARAIAPEVAAARMESAKRAATERERGLEQLLQVAA